MAQPLIMIGHKGGISTSVFRKKTHTDRYLNFSSHHHPQVFAGVVACLRRRAANICDSENEELEVTHLNTVFRANGYTPQCIEPLLQKKYECHQSSATESKQKPPEEESKYLCLPYVRSVSERIDRVCKSIKSVRIKTAFTPVKTLRQVLTRVKNKIPHEKRKVWCMKFHVRSVSRAMWVRLVEH